MAVEKQRTAEPCHQRLQRLADRGMIRTVHLGQSPFPVCPADPVPPEIAVGRGPGRHGSRRHPELNRVALTTPTPRL